jgi:hypothetical protein
MSISEQMTFPFTEGWKTLREKYGRRTTGAGAATLSSDTAASLA